MTFMDIYSWKQAIFSFVVLILGGCFIFAVNSRGAILPAWENFFYILIPGGLFVCFFPVILVEKIITPIKEKRSLKK
jgi:hypothetical protein